MLKNDALAAKVGAGIDNLDVVIMTSGTFRLDLGVRNIRAVMSVITR